MHDMGCVCWRVRARVNVRTWLVRDVELWKPALLLEVIAHTKHILLADAFEDEEENDLELLGGFTDNGGAWSGVGDGDGKGEFPEGWANRNVAVVDETLQEDVDCVQGTAALLPHQPSSSSDSPGSRLPPHVCAP